MVTALAAFKGGVGKTTSALLLADILSRQGSVLVVDTDPQANLTKYYGAKLADIKKKNVLNAIETGNLKKNIMSISENIDLLPSTISLSDFEAKTAHTRELILSVGGWKYYSDETATFEDDPTVHNWRTMKRALPMEIMQIMDTRDMEASKQLHKR